MRVPQPITTHFILRFCLTEKKLDIRGPELLIFDEATSHLDTATERAIQESLKTALAGKTVVLVAHRLSTIKNADLIYVLHRGRIVQAGTHQQLVRENGLYRTFWGIQTGNEDEALYLQEAVSDSNGKNGRDIPFLNGVSHA